MFVITADQIDSRRRADLAAPLVEELDSRFGDRLALPADRNAGDEIQALSAEPAAVLEIVLDLTRCGDWSVGLGIGAVRTPLPRATREATGEAFVAARTAVARAKRAATRFAADATAAPEPAADAEALLTLLLTIREARSAAGWDLYDLVASGLTQAQAGARLGITPQSASDRARTAGVRVELAAHPALTRLLERVDAAQTPARRDRENG
ncbi:DNA-binding protein [Leifsonia xyli subsp. xyli]|uniref:DNA-binding protein n=2 Tax=Leifsonia xyli subsp. xyli TaxID=59736 RepID=Q6AGC3_LEIXX|nr:hypothetical protein [Leifsonia xyli]AAT88572.1 conserved hypothetical protein [Leifsonia xyli subsp. xyli str. CTCB07]ODA90134.1 DNA-binding protein [Leifsonia xyli subsp. xyli]